MAHGVHATLSLPLLAGARSVGALNLYAGVEGAFGDVEAETAALFAAQAAVVLVNAQACEPGRVRWV
jgi:GAF domain-containing protein